MTPTGYVIVSLNLFCLLPSLILLIGAARTPTALSRRFMWLAAMNVLGLLTEATSWLFENDSSVLSYYVVRLSLFFTHIAGYGMLGFFGEYVYTCLSLRTVVSRRPFQVIWVCVGICVALLIVAMFNEMYASFDETNVYQPQDTFFIYLIFPLSGLLFLYLTMRRYSAYLPSRQMSALRWYYGLITICCAVLFYDPELGFHYVVSTLSQIILYINIQMDEAQQREVELVESRTAVMLSQIGPHFIMNVLTDIGALCRMDPDKAREAIFHFSNYLRNNVDALTASRLIPFEKELAHVEHYLWLESMRYGSRLRTIYDISASNFQLPALSLQPLVENAVRHGLAKKKGGGTVTVSSGETEKAWQVRVTDDGVGCIPWAAGNDGRNHVGLVNVRGRLAAVCGGRLILESTPGRGTVVMMEIPKEGGI